MECSPGDVTLRLELKSVVVFSLVFVRTFSWRWPVVLGSPLGHSGAKCASPGFAFKSPPVGLLPAHFTAFGGPQCDPAERGRSPTRPSLGQRASVASNCLGNHPRLFPTWRAASPIPTYHRHDTGGEVALVKRSMRLAH